MFKSGGAAAATSRAVAVSLATSSRGLFGGAVAMSSVLEMFNAPAVVVENGHNYQEELSRLHARIEASRWS